MNREARVAFARTIRSARDLDQAILLLETFERDVLTPTPLDQVEGLNDWTHGGLLQHMFRRTDPAGLNADDLRAMRECQLIGLLAEACEEALFEGDAKTARAMARLANGVLLRVKGEAAWQVAFGRADGTDEGGTVPSA